MYHLDLNSENSNSSGHGTHSFRDQAFRSSPLSYNAYILTTCFIKSIYVNAYAVGIHLQAAVNARFHTTETCDGFRVRLAPGIIEPNAPFRRILRFRVRQNPRSSSPVIQTLRSAECDSADDLIEHLTVSIGLASFLNGFLSDGHFSPFCRICGSYAPGAFPVKDLRFNFLPPSRSPDRSPPAG